MFSLLNSDATVKLISTLLYSMDFFHLQATGVTVRVNHHTHSLLISKNFPFFMNFCTRIRQLS